MYRWRWYRTSATVFSVSTQTSIVQELAVAFFSICSIYLSNYIHPNRPLGVPYGKWLLYLLGKNGRLTYSPCCYAISILEENVMQNVAVEIAPLAFLAKAVVAHAWYVHFVLLSVDEYWTGEVPHLLVVSLMKSVNDISI